MVGLEKVREEGGVGSCRLKLGEKLHRPSVQDPFYSLTEE